MGTFSRFGSGLTALVCMAGLVACATGIQAPEPTPEVFILDGLIAQYGQESPCYQDDTESQPFHDVLCKTEGSLPVELQMHMPLVQVQLEPSIGTA